ncbi:MAG: NTF2 fold immunity protein [Parvibaculum sp.]|uniref:NTF2 fold immunity protein n=1 Tax=Parvibaculum sp. TaxID=2024848 RepID=UPI00283D1BEE|nr:NTF2 fold immunity protein [Parvibaculum sp.]MDR3497751.1 NTF2 fold immunity protein [Parvibaculum sp.]
MHRRLFLSAFLSAPVAMTNLAVAAEDEDISMLLWRSADRDLATREVALAMATMIFKNIYGDLDFESQLPLHITDAGDRWNVEGSRKAEEHLPSKGEAAKGRVEIVILKSNCQVVKLTQKTYLPTGSE